MQLHCIHTFQGITPLSLGIGADAAPAGWQWRRLLDLARLESGHTPSRRHPEYWENGDIPWLALPDIRALDCLVASAPAFDIEPGRSFLIESAVDFLAGLAHFEQQPLIDL